MLKKRVLPVVLMTDYNVLKSIRFSTFRTIGNPISVCRVYDARAVDEMVILDIRATAEGRGPNLEIINDITSECFMPLAVGGGIKTIDQARELLRVGADKVVINSEAVARPEFISELSQEFGAQFVVVSIDALKQEDGTYSVVTHSGTKKTALTPDVWAKQVAQLGAGEILINSIDADGSMKGFDLELVRRVKKAVSIPVIACGGAGKESDFVDAVVQGGADAVAAASVFHFTRITPRMAKETMRDRGIPVRLEAP